MSGRTRSMPSMSSCGNINPASTTRTLFSHSSAHMLMPTSPRPPSGRYRRRGDFWGPRELTPKALSSWGLHSRRSCSASCFGVATAQGDAGRQAVEQLARGADERLALPVLVESRRLAHDHHVGGTRSDPGHGLCARGMESAVLARPDGVVEPEQLLGSAKRL